jgi:hypothetical protein
VNTTVPPTTSQTYSSWAAHRELRWWKEADKEGEGDGGEPHTGDAPHANHSARHVITALQVGLRIAQPDRRGVHQHIHDQVKRDRDGAKQEKRHADVGHDEVGQREDGDDQALNDQDADLHAVLVDLRQERRDFALLRGPQQASAGAADPRHHAADPAERQQHANQRCRPVDPEAGEDLLEGFHQPFLQIDFVVGQHGRHGERAQREQQDDRHRRDQHGHRKLPFRIGHLVGVHGVHLDTREEQDDARQERDITQAGDKRKIPWMGVTTRHRHDRRGVGCHRVQHRDRIALEDPDHRKHHDDHAR